MLLYVSYCLIILHYVLSGCIVSVHYQEIVLFFLQVKMWLANVNFVEDYDRRY